MDSNTPRPALGSRLAILMGTASLLAMAGAMPSYAQGQVGTPEEEVPEVVLITGSLIR